MSALAVSTASAMITFIFSGSAVILRLVEHDLELLAILVITLQHADFGDIREAQDAVRRGIVELCRVQQAAIHRRDDLAAGQRVDGSAKAGEHVNGNADGPELDALEVVGLGDRILELAERLRRHWPRTETKRRSHRSMRTAWRASIA
jgi:hypothetical protein